MKKPRKRKSIGATKGGRHTCTLYPDKTRFKDHSSAVEALHRISNASNTGRKPLRTYECFCGGYHLTGQTIEEHNEENHE